MTRLITFLFIACLTVPLLGANCEPKPLLGEFLDCAAGAAVDESPALIPIVTDILITSGSDQSVTAALKGLALQYGKDIVGCAVIAAIEMFKKKSSRPMGYAGVTNAIELQGITRGQAWLEKQKLKSINQRE